jgi:hypothetical protein
MTKSRPRVGRFALSTVLLPELTLTGHFLVFCSRDLHAAHFLESAEILQQSRHKYETSNYFVRMMLLRTISRDY